MLARRMARYRRVQYRRVLGGDGGWVMRARAGWAPVSRRRGLRFSSSEADERGSG